MRTHARVVVIGSGIMGCSLLYYLVRQGWKDVVLLEKDELTSGTTWSSMGMCTHYTANAAMLPFHFRSSQIYAGLEEETGQPAGFHKVGSIRIGTTQDQMNEYRRFLAHAAALDIPADIIGPNEVKNLYPGIEVGDVIGAVYTPEDGYTDPSQSTMAFAAGARAGGAEINRFTTVTGISHRPSGEWEVVTDKGTIIAGMVVNAAGMWLPEIAAMVGVKLPVVAMERQYVVTGDLPEIAAVDHRLPALRDPTNRFTAKQEHGGLVCGVWEKEGQAPLWALDGIPSGLSHAILETDLDRAADSLMGMAARLPSTANVGIRKAFCGPTSRTADLLALVGPLPGVPDFFVFGGCSAGITKGPASAELLAEWLVEGEPSRSLWPLDVRRFGSHVDRDTVCAIQRKSHSYNLKVAFPNIDEHGDRPVKMSPVHDRLAAQGARFIARNGWECPDVFVPLGEPGERGSFGKPDWTAHVAAEYRSVTSGAGILDLTSMPSFELSGPGASGFVQSVLAGRVSPGQGNVSFATLLTRRGGIRCLFGISRISADRFRLTAPAVAEVHHFDCLERLLPRDDSVRLTNLTGRNGIFLLCGPKAGAILRAATDGQIDSNHCAPLTARFAKVRFAPVWVVRADGAGLDNWELHHPIEHQIALYENLRAHGDALGLTNFGMRTYETLRLEQSRVRWGPDFGETTPPDECGLSYLTDSVDPGVPERDSRLSKQGNGPDRRLATLTAELSNPDDWLWGGEPVLANGVQIGTVTSAAFGHGIGRHIALAYLPASAGRRRENIEIEVLGRRYAATVSDGIAQREPSIA